MPSNILIPDESTRLKILHSYGLLDTLPEGTFDSLTELAAQVFDMPVALITLVDSHRIWFKSHYGLDLSEIAREPGLCDTAIATGEVLYLSDTTQDVKAAGNSLVYDERSIRFYAGAPITVAGGYHLGTICLLDYKPRTLTTDQLATLKKLAKLAAELIEARRIKQPGVSLPAGNNYLAHPVPELNPHAILLEKIRTEIASELDLKALIKVVVDQITQIFNYAHAAIFMIEDGVLKISYQIGFKDFYQHIPLDKGITGRAARTGQPILVQDVSKDPDYLMVTPGVTSEMAIPLFDQNRVVGVLDVEAYGDTPLNHSDLSLLKIMGELINPALGRARLYSEAKAREQFLSSIFNGVEEVMFVIDVDDQNNFRYAGMNNAAESYGQVKSENWVGRTIEQVWPLEVQESIKKPYLQVVESRQSLVMEEYIPVNGNYHWRLTRFTPLLNDQGQVYRIIGSGTDITRLKMIEQELTEEKEQRDITLSSIAEGVIATDKEGTIRLINPMAAILLGLGEGEGSGKHLCEVYITYDPATGESRTCPLEKLAETDDVIIFPEPTLLVSKNGEQRLIASNAAPVRDRNGNLDGLVLAFRDVTEINKLAEEQLKAGKLEALGILAGGIAHDFNNILTSILGNISICSLFVSPGSEMAELLEEAQVACMQAKALTEQLLTFAKGGAPVKKTAQMVEIIRDSSQFAIRGSGVNCEFILPENLWPVEVDRGQVSQVIQNLVINAIQAMDGKGWLKVIAENVQLGEDSGLPLRPDNYIKVTVEDTGQGIPSENLLRIFDPYFSTKPQGSGLGLAICYSIIKKHEGYIKADSIINQGTTISFYLPAVKNKIPEKIIPSMQIPTGKGRILVMDDEESIRRVVIRILTHLGYTVNATTNGREAIEAYRQALEAGERYDAVVMDLTIPGGLGGQEAIQYILGIDPTAAVLVSSGYSNDPVLANYRDYGFKGVLVKPFTIEKLSTALQAVVNNL